MDLQFATKSNVFWILFALTGALLVIGFPWTEVFLGILVIFLGLNKLAGEVEFKKQSEERQAIHETMEEIRNWINSSHEYSKMMETKFENRFFQANKKRIDQNRKISKVSRDTEKLIEKNQRELVRKILEIDNKLTEVSRAFLTKKPRSGRKI